MDNKDRARLPSILNKLRNSKNPIQSLAAECSLMMLDDLQHNDLDTEFGRSTYRVFNWLSYIATHRMFDLDAKGNDLDTIRGAAFGNYRGNAEISEDSVSYGQCSGTPE